MESKACEIKSGISRPHDVNGIDFTTSFLNVQFLTWTRPPEKASVLRSICCSFVTRKFDLCAVLATVKPIMLRDGDDEVYSIIIRWGCHLEPVYL